MIARDMQRAGAGLRSIAEPVVDTTSDFAELVLAMLGVAAKLERRRILERTARGRADGKGEGRQTRPQAETHRASTARGAAADRRRRDTAQRRAQLQCQSGDDFTARGLTHHPVAPSSLLAERRAAAVIGATANAAAPAEPAQKLSGVCSPVGGPSLGMSAIFDHSCYLDNASAPPVTPAVWNSLTIIPPHFRVRSFHSPQGIP